MSVSVDGFIADREGAFAWGVPSDELFRFYLDQVRGLGSCLLGRRLYETMLVWETDPSLRDNEDTDAFADVWGALPKVVFSRTLDSVQGNVRLAEAPLAEEAAAALDATDKDVEVGGAGLAAAAIELGLVDELRMFRYLPVRSPAVGRMKRAIVQSSSLSMTSWDMSSSSRQARGSPLRPMTGTSQPSRLFVSRA